jgi:flagellar biosynthesis/type III secretory pathway chaperone
MPAERKSHSLPDILTRQVQCTEHLLTCLGAERDALASRDIQTLEDTTATKLQYTRELEQLEQQRQQLMVELGFGDITDNESLRRCFKSLPQAETLLKLWGRILTNLDTARHGNLANGGILEAGRRHVEQALMILRGQTATPALYNPNGDRSANLGQRDLGKV